jgi:hypothetical protein
MLQYNFQIIQQFLTFLQVIKTVGENWIQTLVDCNLFSFRRIHLKKVVAEVRHVDGWVPVIVVVKEPLSISHT